MHDLTNSPKLQLSILACRMVPWIDNHHVEMQHYVPDGRPVPIALALASRKVQLVSMLDFLKQQGAQAIYAYDSRDGAEWSGVQLGAEVLGQLGFQPLHQVETSTKSVLYLVDDPQLTLKNGLKGLWKTVAGRLRATAAQHWLAIQAEPDRVDTADFARLQSVAVDNRWQLDAVWSTAPPEQCYESIMEAGSDEDAVELYPYLLLALRCSAADHKAPSRQSSGARNELSPSGPAVRLCRHCDAGIVIQSA